MGRGKGLPSWTWRGFLEEMVVELCGEGCAVVLAIEMGRPFQADESNTMEEKPGEADPVRKNLVGHSEEFGLY